jgi:hypothetical protein
VTPKRLRRRGVTADAPMNFFILTVYDANLSRSEAFFFGNGKIVGVICQHDMMFDQFIGVLFASIMLY